MYFFFRKKRQRQNVSFDSPDRSAISLSCLSQYIPTPSAIKSLYRPHENNSSNLHLAPSTSNVLSQATAYLWSSLDLILCPPIVLAKFGAVPPTFSSPPPFPRYGHSVPATATPTGDLYIFGGFVHDVARNDIHLLSTHNRSVSLLQTNHDVPSARVGHACALFGNILVVWGGETRFVPFYNEKLDEDIYFLDLASKEWARVTVHGPAPVGRYGHTATVLKSKLLVFGGWQVKGGFSNDLWCLDLDTFQTEPIWEFIEPVGEVPARRMGHVCIAHGDQIIIFGGTDGNHHYNDTWQFDIHTHQWSELQCAGSTPSPREGHAAAVVHNVIYIFGGQGMDGKDLHDLWAFNISNRRWHMFQSDYMGPTPYGRSGHAMASVDSKIYLLGGESLSQKRDSPTTVHILNTDQIKYPSSKDSSPTTIQQSVSGISAKPVPDGNRPVKAIGFVLGSYSNRDSQGNSEDVKPKTPWESGLVEDVKRQVLHLALAEGELPGPSSHISNKHNNTFPEQSNQKHQFTDENLKLIESFLQNLKLIYRIQAVLTDKQEYKKLLTCKGTNAQRLLDVFQRILDTTTDLSPNFRRNLIVATQRLAAASGLYPMSYELTGVTTSDISEYSGGFSDIYKGDFRGHTVSLKTIRLHKNTQMPHFVKVVSKEAILWGQLHHTNVLPFYGIYRLKSWISLVAPWMDNGHIGEYLKHHRDSSRVVLAYDVAQGLHFLHKNKIIHGDLKGTNVLINEKGRACLADFGLSSISDKEILAWTSYSSAASKGGTVRWQAPELFDSESDIEERNTEASDIYAWACVAYEIFTGEIPLAHLNRDATIIKQVSEGERPAQPPRSSPSWTVWGLTTSIWTLMQVCWSARSAERPPAQTIIDQLAPMLPPDLQAESNNSFLSSRVFREMARGIPDDDFISIETLESLLVQ